MIDDRTSNKDKTASDDSDLHTFATSSKLCQPDRKDSEKEGRREQISIDSRISEQGVQLKEAFCPRPQNHISMDHQNSECSSTTNKRSVFNRSVTLYSSSYQYPKKQAFPSLDRSTSVKKWYDSLESAGNSLKGKVSHLRSLFERPPTKTLNYNPQQQSQSLPEPSQYQSINKSKHTDPILDASTIKLPGTEDRVVVYFTSLRGIRRTFEDCYAVRMILRGYRVYVDERDVSMDIALRKELQSILCEKNVSLPQVFIKGSYIGGADVIKQLNEAGELRKLLEGLPLRRIGFMCDSCGDIRFVPCTNCSGSKKIFDDDDGVMKRCPDCNENGLIRCPECRM